MYDVITIGSATTDVFIQTDGANIASIESVNGMQSFMSYPYGAKTEISDFKMSIGGGAVNTACNFAKLGMNVSAIVKTGDDDAKNRIKRTLEQFGVHTDDMVEQKGENTGFSVVLISFKGDRTVLAHRGPNSNIKIDDIDFEALKNSRWLYIAPLNGNSTEVLDKIAEFAENNGVNTAINVGTSSIKKGKKYLSKILKTAEVVILNSEEASMLTEIQVRPDSSEHKFSGEFIHPDMKEMLSVLKSTRAKIVIITDGKNGAYALDDKYFYKCPEFPAKVVSTLGAGDAFASTFVASFDRTGDMETSLVYASINSSSVVSAFDAHEGLLSFPEIKARSQNFPDYRIEKIER